MRQVWQQSAVMKSILNEEEHFSSGGNGGKEVRGRFQVIGKVRGYEQRPRCEDKKLKEGDR